MHRDDTMISNRANNRIAGDHDPIVVLAADDYFAMPLATTVRSALDNLAADARLRIFVLDGGIKERTKHRLLRSWPEGRYDVDWIRVDASVLAGSPVSGHVNLVSYYRILIPRLLPTDVRRVIYLDSDLLICADLAQLWAHDATGRLCLAVQDCSAPYIDSSQALANHQRCSPYVGCIQPIPNFRELGLDPRAEYFNAGVLLIDLAAWRDADLSAQLLGCLAQNKKHVRWWDQYAMNVVLAGRWGPLDPRWNQGSHIFRYPTWQQSPYDQLSYERQRNDPFIVHFTTRHKPWRASCRHPLRQKFFDCMERTDWAGWRLPRLGLFLEAIKNQERRFRHGRRWLRDRARQWLQPGGEQFPPAAG
jgi:lipopolysaccharide biosynthesis glycosyltransferase